LIPPPPKEIENRKSGFLGALKAFFAMGISPISRMTGFPISLIWGKN